jgi:hypothetical protein
LAACTQGAADDLLANESHDATEKDRSCPNEGSESDHPRPARVLLLFGQNRISEPKKDALAALWSSLANDRFNSVDADQ